MLGLRRESEGETRLAAPPAATSRDRANARGLTDYTAEARAAMVLDANPLAGLSVLLLVMALVVGLVWADQAVLDEVTRGDGEVVPSSREQVVQSLEGGILEELLVSEGDVVDAGQVLLRIDSTRASASLSEAQARVRTLRAKLARLLAEATGSELRFESETPAELARVERALFASRRNALAQGMAAIGRSLDLARQELRMTEPLVSQGAVSQVEVLRLRRQVNELSGQVQQQRNEFRAGARAELAEVEGELAQLGESNRARADEVRRTVLRAPLRGTVKNIRTTTVGGVIGPGQPIMEIVPLEDRLLVEARIHPKDVAFLRPGLPATVKITAYDYAIYGGLKGTVELISADTLDAEQPGGERFYRVRVGTAASALEGADGPLPIIPGMTASVEVLTGRKTVLEYLLKPVLKLKERALKER